MQRLCWSPEQYARHAAPRLRPGLDLLARVPEEDVASIVDLGCGNGALFPVLRERWPGARLVGVDNAPEMLAAARAADPTVELVPADAATWAPAEPVDLIVANAVLHWVPSHDSLLPRLLASCRWLAVQMPMNFDAPSHRLLGEVAARPDWRGRLDGLALGEHVGTPRFYHGLLSGRADPLDIWETVYWHVLAGEDPVLSWVRGTALLPVTARLGGRDSPDYRRFETLYAERLRAAYPPEPDGRTLFPFRRLLIVARARAPGAGHATPT